MDYTTQTKEQLIELLQQKEENFKKIFMVSESHKEKSNQLEKELKDLKFKQNIGKQQVLGMCFKIACENECVFWENEESKSSIERIKKTTKILFKIAGELQEELLK